jgi:HEPN domain-containing protein
MKPEIAEWVTKAEADLATARREFQVRRQPNHDAVCFHAQQCVEKYLKARLVDAGIGLHKTHDLVALLASVVRAEPLWEAWKPALAKLTHYAVTVRYPGESAAKRDAAEALKFAERIRTEIRLSLGLELPPAGGRKRARIRER